MPAEQQTQNEVAGGIDPLLTAKDVHLILKTSLPTVYNMEKRGQLPSVSWPNHGKGKRAARSIRFKLSDIMNFIENNYGQETR